MKLLSNCNCNSTDILWNAIIENVIVIEPRSAMKYEIWLMTRYKPLQCLITPYTCMSLVFVLVTICWPQYQLPTIFYLVVEVLIYQLDLAVHQNGV